MKIIGLMPVRNEADLLPESFPHHKGLVDDLFVYVGKSVDDTYEIVKAGDPHYLVREEDDKTKPSIRRRPYHHILQAVKKNYDYKREPVWIVTCMGDRFFLNRTPRQIVESAEENGFESVSGVKAEFIRCRADGWTRKNDTWPNYSDNIRKLARWLKYDVFERQVIAYKVNDRISFLSAQYTWPKGIGRTPQFEGELTVDTPFHEHHGKRSPKALMWRFRKGCVDGRLKHGYDYGNWRQTRESYRRYFRCFTAFPWLGPDTLEQVVEYHNGENSKNQARQRAYFKGIEDTFIHVLDRRLPDRTDI